MRILLTPRVAIGLIPSTLIFLVIACGRGPGPGTSASAAPRDFGPLVVSSPAFEDGGTYPAEFTCEGSGASPPIEWKGAPAGTKSFALNVWHIPGPGDIKSYWLLYNIPAEISSLPKNVQGVGVTGLNDKRRNEYDPMCSKGPGLKTYQITLYALSDKLPLDPRHTDRSDFLKAVEKIVLSQKTLTYQFARSNSGENRKGAQGDDGPSDSPPADEAKPKRKGQGKGKGQGKAKGQGQGQRKSKEGLGSGRQTDPNDPPPFHTAVAKHPVDIILGRPTLQSITLSIVPYEDGQGYIAYGRTENGLRQRSKPITLPGGEPVEVVLDSLDPDAGYVYRLDRKRAGASDFSSGETGSFHTQRPAGKPFVFTIQADSHLDLGTEPDIYLRTLKNALADRPDFHIELGDTFMTDKFARFTDAITQYRAQRYYFGQICHSAPLFFVLGNHDGEIGTRLDGTAESMPVWSANTRKRYFPNPYPDRFYTGNTAEEPHVGKLGDYYAWEWGDALCVVLDPFWYSKERRGRGKDGWSRTLGEVQYRWLEKTLETSRATFKFVFIHHLVGGATPEARGGAEAARFFEWGGRNLDGSWAFDTKRPGWSRPIHKLLVDTQVSAVFHGHDHFYAHQELDGMVYQLVPQPGGRRYGEPNSAEEYGYLQGDLRSGPGYVRVSVSPERAAVDYVLSVLPEDERNGRKNGKVMASYSMPGSQAEMSRRKSPVRKTPR